MIEKGTMTNTLRQEKSMLAQLLATENITVVHDKGLETAAFDPINRKLFLPVFKEMSGPLYDLLVLHEVSHALHTPAEGFHSEKHPKGSRFKGFLNVVEDARIEKLIKRRYPGGRSGMINGYHDLLERDFFGIKNMNANDLPFVDRFNLYFKVGMTLNMKFSEKEMEFIERGMNLETWDDTEKLTLDLWEYAKDEELTTDIQAMLEDMKFDNSQPIEESESEEGDEPMKSSGESEADMEEGSDNSEETKDQGLKSKPGQGSEGAEDDKDSSVKSGSSKDLEDVSSEKLESEEPTKFEDHDPTEGGGFGTTQDRFEEHVDKDPLSITDTNFRQHESELSDDKFEGVTLNAFIPEYKHEDYTIDYKTMLEYFTETYGETSNFEERYSGRYGWGYNHINRWENSASQNSRYQNFVAANKPMVRHMVKEFEMRKSAAMHERSRIHQSGIINPSSLYKYKFDDRIFKAVTSTPEGKNHGLVFFIDCSGSMQHVFGTVIEQTALMAMFCQMVKIPFRVFGFTNFGLGRRYDSPLGNKLSEEFDGFINSRRREEEVEGEIQLDHTMRFFELYNDKMSKREFQLMGEYLISLSDMGQCPIPLSGTPLNEVIILGIDLVNDFKNQYGLDICNTILLTDGESSSGAGVCQFETRPNREGILSTRKFFHHVTGQDICVYRHKKTGTVWSKTAQSKRQRYYRNNATEYLLSFFEKCTGQQIIGINIFPKFNYHMANDMDINLEEARGIIRKNGYIAGKAKGYSKLFSVPNKNLMITDESDAKFHGLEAGSKTSSITRSFKSLANRRKSQRLFLTEFVTMVA